MLFALAAMSVRFFALIMAVALSVSASAQVAPVRCEDSDRFLNTKLASQYSHTEIVNALDIENTKLVLFGEYHWNYEAGDLLSVFSEINTHFPTKKKCLFIESMTANTPGSNAQIWTGKAENHPFLALAPSAQGFFGYDGDAFPYLELFSAAQLAGYKLINIDSDPSGRFDRSAAASAEIVSPAGMSYRNRFMAVSINEHFAKGNCEKGIYFVGKAHIANDDKMEPFVQNIDSHLKELGFGAVKRSICKQSN